MQISLLESSLRTDLNIFYLISRPDIDLMCDLTTILGPIWNH